MGQLVTPADQPPVSSVPGMTEAAMQKLVDAAIDGSVTNQEFLEKLERLEMLRRFEG